MVQYVTSIPRTEMKAMVVEGETMQSGTPYYVKVDFDRTYGKNRQQVR